MSRRTLFEDVMSMPWPVGAIAALVVFILFQFVLSNPLEGHVGAAIMPIVKVVGWFFTLMFLVAALFSLLSQLIRGKRFKATRSLADIRSLDWRQFETFVGEAFRQQGYFVLETPEGPDNGVDLVLRKDGEKTYVQCKHWKTNQVGVDKVRELLGSMAAGGAQAGIFVTSGTYTRPARDLARECGIRLMDGVQLAQLLEDHAPIEPHDAKPAGIDVEPACPLCNAKMVQRVAKRGKNAGNSFWGCSRYPQCRGIRNS